MSQDAIAEAALGGRAEALDEPASLATPLTMGRLAGRDQSALVMRQIAEAFDVGPAEFVAETPDRDIVTFVGQADGHRIGLFALLTRGDAGTYTAVDLYAGGGTLKGLSENARPVAGPARVDPGKAMAQRRAFAAAALALAVLFTGNNLPSALYGLLRRSSDIPRSRRLCCMRCP
jgi:hypothetical protein